jgi:hypothetical protein
MGLDARDSLRCCLLAANDLSSLVKGKSISFLAPAVRVFDVADRVGNDGVAHGVRFACESALNTRNDELVRVQASSS